MEQVMFYGNVQKAQTVLACVQASIETVARDVSKCGAGSRSMLSRYLAELEEIESDLVSLINVATGKTTHPGDPGDGAWPADAPDGDVH